MRIRNLEPIKEKASRIEPKKILSNPITNTNIVLVGFDPSTVNCGYAVLIAGETLDTSKLLMSGSFEPIGKEFVDYTARYTNLLTKRVYPFLIELKRRYPEHTIIASSEWIIPFINGYSATVEKTNAKGETKVSTVQKAPSSTIQLAGVGGGLRTIFSMLDIDWLDFPVGEVKAVLTGSAKAAKPEIISAVSRKFNVVVKTDHEADAISVASACYNSIYHILRNEGKSYQTAVKEGK